MATLLGPSDWDDVRAAIDAQLTAALLPDRVIASPIYAAEARRRVLARVPDPDSLSAEQQLSLRTAAILMAASLITPIVPTIVNERDKDYSYQRQAPNFADVAYQLRARADEMLGELAGEIVATEASAHAGWLFGRASADRGVF